MSSVRTAARLFAYCAEYVITAVLPRRSDGWLEERLAALYVRMQSRRVEYLASKMARMLGPVATSRDFLPSPDDRRSELEFLQDERARVHITHGDSDLV